MGQIERTLAKLRQRQSGKPQTAAEMNVDSLARARVAARLDPEPELLTNATILQLDADHLRQNRIVSQVDNERGTAAYKMLRTRVLQRMRSNDWNRLAITSPRSDAGKTVTAINTAMSLAQDPNQHVVLLDLDLRNPRVGSYLGIRAEPGLAALLMRDTPLDSVIYRIEDTNLYVVPTEHGFENSSEMLASAEIATLVDRLAATFGMVLFDLPPLLDADDALAFSPHIDALLFVVAQGDTRRSDVEKSSDLLKDMNVLGVVLNKSDEDAPGYY
jgi:protein-tyrosine kinase